MVGHPQRPSVSPWQRRHERSCEESYPGQPCRKCGKEHGNGKDLHFRISGCGRLQLREFCGLIILTSSSRVETGDLAEVGMVLHYKRQNRVSHGIHLEILQQPKLFLFSPNLRMSIFIKVAKGRGIYRTLSAEEFARDVEGFTSHYNNLLAIEQLLGHNAGQATKEVSLAVDDDLYPRQESSQFFEALIENMRIPTRQRGKTHHWLEGGHRALSPVHSQVSSKAMSYAR